ncbi:hypothetical protein DAI22_02g083000 [Oryza sativa Japonica Group]|nr:hypothetical protein DAI22_02g083000 [Oryza sativa Japonica Group]
MAEARPASSGKYITKLKVKERLCAVLHMLSSLIVLIWVLVRSVMSIELSLLHGWMPIHYSYTVVGSISFLVLCTVVASTSFLIFNRRTLS